jgi:hypothetical protein
MRRIETSLRQETGCEVAPGTAREVRSAPMNTGLARRGRFALGGVTLVALGWVAAPWVFCSETWAIERDGSSQATDKCPYEEFRTPVRRSLRESAPPLAPFVA